MAKPITVDVTTNKDGYFEAFIEIKNGPGIKQVNAEAISSIAAGVATGVGYPASASSPGPASPSTTVSVATIGPGTTNNVSMTLSCANAGTITYAVLCTHGATGSTGTLPVVAGVNVFTNFANSVWAEVGNWTLNVTHSDGSNDSYTIVVT